ncbi:MAG: lytic transglycosylase domain-containing protein [Candidatus Aminicenantes bacterium]|nr:lytic transglycosylase domain-containing protein [Candidatus Aminicenantes bacterium]
MRTQRREWRIGRAVGLFLAAAPFLLSFSFRDKLRTTYDPAIRTISGRHGLDPQLVHAVIQAESAYNRWAVSSAGAQGLMQLMPSTASYYGVRDVFDIDQNIEGGVKFLRDLQELYRNEVDPVARLKKILAAYNAGQEAVKKYNGIPPYAETRAYIARVMSTYAEMGARRKTVIIDFWTSDGKHVVTNVLSVAAARASPASSPE